MKQIEKKEVVIVLEENLYNLLNVELPTIMGLSKKGEVNSIIRNTYFTSDKETPEKIVWIITPAMVETKKVWIKFLVNIKDSFEIHSISNGTLRICGSKKFDPYQNLWFNGSYDSKEKRLIGEVMDESFKESSQLAWKQN